MKARRTQPKGLVTTSSAPASRTGTSRPFSPSRTHSTAEASDDTIAAIATARKAFDEGPWPLTPAAERGALLFRVAGLIERDTAELARADGVFINSLGLPMRGGRDVPRVLRDLARLVYVIRIRRS